MPDRDEPGAAAPLVDAGQRAAARRSGRLARCSSRFPRRQPRGDPMLCPRRRSARPAPRASGWCAGSERFRSCEGSGAAGAQRADTVRLWHKIKTIMQTQPNQIAIATATGHFFFAAEEIVRLEACSNYTNIYFTDKRKEYFMNGRMNMTILIL